MSSPTFAPRITPFLWFNTEASDAVDFYVSIFPNSRRIDAVQLRHAPGEPTIISFELGGQPLTAFNGGPGHTFTEAISLVVRCDSQAEIDSYWSKLLAGGGQEIACGWLKDKYGLCWQIVPARIAELVSHPKAMQAMLSMKKLDIAELERASQP